MRLKLQKRWINGYALVLLVLAQTIAIAAGPLQAKADPASLGFSPVRLGRLHDYMQQVTGAGECLGAVTLVARHGEIVDWHAYGHRDISKTSPMQKDSIFRIYSMTKTITSVAVLMLMEEGRLTLNEPVAKFLPEFSNMQVFAGGTADKPVLRPAATQITIHQLLTHTAGFACDGPDDEEAVKLYNRTDLHQSGNLAEFCAKLSRLPLATDPGEAYAYGVSLDVLGRLVEIVSGMPFEEFLQKRIFEPLNMVDTGFEVALSQRGRVVDMATTGPDGTLRLAKSRTAAQPGKKLNLYNSGAGGLYSTAADYFRFAQMLLSDGEHGGTVLLSRKTLELMMSNNLAYLGPKYAGYSKGVGFGLGGRVVVDITKREWLASPGQFGWSGAGSTYYTVDRQEKLITILLMQHMPQDQQQIRGKFYNLVYQSLAK